MDFAGWEKLDLENFDGYIATTLFAAGCDFRCPFCHNSDLVLHPERIKKIPWEDIMEYLARRRNVIEAVCVTGGEPTLMPDLLEKLADIKKLGYLVKLDSNGSRPEILRIAIRQELVDYVAMDIKNAPAKYAMTIGTTSFDMEDIRASASFLIKGHIPYEFRTTAIAEYHSERDFEEMGAWLEGAERFYIQRYIDGENCIAHGLHELSKEKALVCKAILEKSVKKVALRGYD
jgi:pyruvate formate lyase activating enzyme